MSPGISPGVNMDARPISLPAPAVTQLSLYSDFVDSALFHQLITFTPLSSFLITLAI